MRQPWYADVVYAVAITVVLLVLLFNTALYARQVATPMGDPSSVSLTAWLTQQGALGGILVVILYFYRRDFSQQHTQMLQNQAILIQALNDTRAALVELRTMVQRHT